MNLEKVSWKISDSSGNPISGVVPTCLIIRVIDGYIFDWNDLSFKASGWTNKSNNFSETDPTDIPGIYGIEFDISAFDDGFYQFYGAYQGPYGQTSEYEFNVSSGAIIALSDIPNLVRENLSPELAHIMVLQNGMGLNSIQATMLLEIYRLYGLDPTRPLIVNDVLRSAGDLTQTIIATSTSTTVQRN